MDLNRERVNVIESKEDAQAPQEESTIEPQVEQIEEEEEDVLQEVTYHREVTSLLLGKTTDNLKFNMIFDENEIQQLEKENMELDNKIFNLMKKIQDATKQSTQLDRQLQTNTKKQEQTVAKKQKTRDITKVLMEPIEQMQSCTASTKDQVKKLTDDIDSYVKLQRDLEENQRKVAFLESEITEALKRKAKNVVEADPNLVNENNELKKTLAQKRNNLEDSKLKFEDFKKLKYDADKLVKDFCDEQEKNIVLLKNCSAKKDKLQTLKEELDRNVIEMEQTINQNAAENKRIQEDIQKILKSSSENKSNIEELEKINIELETKIEKIDLKIEETKADLANKLENEKKNLEEVDEKFENLCRELVKIKNVHHEKSEVKTKTNSLLLQILETKNASAKKEIELVKEQHAFALISDEINSKKTKLENLLKEKSQVDTEITQVQDLIDNHGPEVLQKKLEGLNAEFGEVKNNLVKQGDFLRASIELLDVKMNTVQKEVQASKQRKKDLQSQKTLDDMKLDSLKNTVKLWDDRYKKMETEYNALFEIYTKEVAESAISGKNATEVAPKSPSAKENLLGESSRSENKNLPQSEPFVVQASEPAKSPRSPKRPGSPLDATFVKHDNKLDDVESGRKSPGILKDPRSPKPPDILPKSVRFEGLSSLSSNESISPNPFDKEMRKYQEQLAQKQLNISKQKPILIESDSESQSDDLSRFRPPSRQSFKKREFD